jgi:uncharacterized membrane protein
MKFHAKSGAAIASAALALAVSGVTMTAATTAIAGEEAKVHCVGVNTCQGTSDCATASNSCAGQNSCKGQGFVSMTKSQCEKIGGTVES